MWRSYGQNESLGRRKFNSIRDNENNQPKPTKRKLKDINLRNRAVSCLYYKAKKFRTLCNSRNFYMQVFQIWLEYYWPQPITFQKFVSLQYNDRNWSENCHGINPQYLSKETNGVRCCSVQSLCGKKTRVRVGFKGKELPHEQEKKRKGDKTCFEIKT